MDRIPEPEIMDDPVQALAYARADFSEPHNHFIDLFKERFGDTLSGRILDLGCGPGDICRRLAKAFPECHIHGVDASMPMLELARADSTTPSPDKRIEYFQGYLPAVRLPLPHYDILTSNSLLHHLQEPDTLWQSIAAYGQPGSIVFVMDLLRPDSRAQAARLLAQYAGNEPDVLQTDFFNSLLAAYRPDEVTMQLAQQGLGQLRIEVVSDRHFIVSGRL